MNLIEVDENDYELLSRVFKNKTVMLYTLDDCYTDDELYKYFQKILKNNQSDNRVHYEYKVVEDGNFIGFADFEIIRKIPNAGIAEIGYLLLPEYWNKGYGTRIANVLIHICFNELGLHKVVANCNASNIGSWRIMEKVGMTKEGEFKKHRFKNGRYADEYQYSLIKKDNLTTAST